MWAHGGEIAVQDGDDWDAQFSSDESVAGLEQLQEVYLNATNAPADGDEADPQVPFCAGEVGYLSAPGWVKWSILAPADAENPGCPDTYGKDLAAFPLPGVEGRRDRADLRRWLERRRRAEERQPRDGARPRSRIILSEGYQKLLAEGGLTPGSSRRPRRCRTTRSRRRRPPRSRTRSSPR